MTLCKISQTWPFLSICSAKSITIPAPSYCNIFCIIFACPLAMRSEILPWWCLLTAVLLIMSYPVFTSSPFILPLASPSVGRPSPTSSGCTSRTSSLLKPYMSRFCFPAIANSLYTFWTTHDATFHPSLIQFSNKCRVSWKEFLLDVDNVNWLTSHKSL